MSGEIRVNGRDEPLSAATVAELLDQYIPVAGWDVSTEGAK